MSRGQELPYRLAVATKLLEANGFDVIPQERRVLLHATYIITRKELEDTKSFNRLADAAVEDNLRCLIRKAFDEGLLSHERREAIDGDNAFSSFMTIIKPEEE